LGEGVNGDCVEGQAALLGERWRIVEEEGGREGNQGTEEDNGEGGHVRVIMRCWRGIEGKE